MRYKSSSVFARHPVWIAVLYCGASAAWIFLTDRYLVWLKVNVEIVHSVEIAKGFVYVAISGLLIYKAFAKLNTVNQNLERMVSERTASLSQRETELQRKAETLRTLIDGVPASLVMLDRRTCCIEVSDRFCKEYGWDRSQVIGKSYYELFPELPERWKESHRKGFAGYVVSEHDDVFVDPNKKEHRLRWAIRPWGDAGESSGGIVIFMEDTTEQYLLQRQLQQAQKMEAIGSLAGGMAHDFNNLLGIMLGYCELSLAAVPSDSLIRQHLEQVKNAIHRATSLTRQLLAFSRRQTIFPKVLNLDEVIANTSKMLTRLVGEDIEILLVKNPSPAFINADAGQIDQVLMNLVVNARDAMPTGGKIVIKTESAQLDDHYAARHMGGRAGNYVCLSVTDTGCGMDESVKRRIFEPFFTTKEMGNGTGLGLSTVYGIVKQNQGYIAVYSEPGMGTTFKIYFPKVAEASQGVVSAIEASKPPLSGSATLLVAEDNEALRELTAAILGNAGYRVLQANSAESALTLLKTSGVSVDLLITDLIMQGQSGTDLMQQAQKMCPTLPCLFISGYPAEVLMQRGNLIPGNPLLEKPFTRDDLLSRVRSILYPAN